MGRATRQGPRSPVKTLELTGGLDSFENGTGQFRAGGHEGLGWTATQPVSSSPTRPLLMTRQPPVVLSPSVGLGHRRCAQDTRTETSSRAVGSSWGPAVVGHWHSLGLNSRDPDRGQAGALGGTESADEEEHSSAGEETRAEGTERESSTREAHCRRRRSRRDSSADEPPTHVFRDGGCGLAPVPTGGGGHLKDLAKKSSDEECHQRLGHHH